MRISVLVATAILLAMLCPVQSQATGSRESPGVENTETPQTIVPAEPWYRTTAVLFSAIASVISAIIGGFAGAGICIWYSRKQARQEYRSLILAFCSELVSTFHRCVMYYEQAKTSGVSYSALFSFTDASALSKVASVCQEPEVVASIIELKSKYFQIQRHVEEAARYAVEERRAFTEHEKAELWTKARLAQGTAVGFFLSYYEDIEKETSRIVAEAKRAFPKGKTASYLASKFSKDKEKKANLDAGAQKE